MNQVHIQSRAADDAERAARWYESQRTGLGVEFILELDAAVERASEIPEAYAPQYRDARRVLLRRFPYAVYFVFDKAVVEVFAILDQHRDPSLWQSRLR